MVQFVKQSDIDTYPNRCFSAGLSSAYKDVFNNSQTTIDVANKPFQTGVFLEIPTSITPPYGSGEVVGYKLGLYMNEIETDQASNPSLTIWKAKKGITSGQGNFGQTVLQGTDVYAMCSYPEYVEEGYFTEGFDSIKTGYVKTAGPDAHKTVSVSGNYMTCANTWKAMGDWNINNHGLTYDEFVDDWGLELPNGLKVIWFELHTKFLPGPPTDIDIWAIVPGGEPFVEFVERKYWAMLHPTDDDPDEWLNRAGYCEFNEGDIEVLSTYETTVERKGEAEKQVEVENTTLHAITTNAGGTILRYSDTGNTMLYKNGIYRDWETAKEGITSARFTSVWDNNILSSEDTIRQCISTTDGNGLMSTNCIHQNQFPTPIQLTKEEGSTATQEATTTTDVCGTDLVIKINIAELPDIACKSATEAYFPSRCMAVWFKNRLHSSSSKNHENIMEDLRLNYYGYGVESSGAASTSTDFIAMDASPASPGHNVFSGFFLYRFNNNYYVKDISNSSGAGTNFEASGAGEAFSDYVPTNAMAHPTTGSTRIPNSLSNKWVDMICRWTAGAGNGFKLLFRDKTTGKMLADEIEISTTAAGTEVNNTYAFPYYSIATYNCASLGTDASTAVNHRPAFDGLDTAAEVGNMVSSDSPLSLRINCDMIGVSKYGLNYTHKNATVSSESTGAKLSIASRDGPDFSQTISEGDVMEVATERTNTANSIPTFLSFGFKNAADVKGDSAGRPQHLFFSGFTCSNPAGNSPINNAFMKWAWSTDAALLGSQLWSADEAGTGVIDVGTLSDDNSQFATSGLSQNLFFNSDEANINTATLSMEGFQQKGHMLWDEYTFTNHSKRENIFCSARVAGSNGRTTTSDSLSTGSVQDIYVDDPSIFTKWSRGKGDDSGETYVIYQHGKPNRPTYKRTGLTCTGSNVEGNKNAGYALMTFNKDVTKSDANVAATAVGGIKNVSTTVEFNSGSKRITCATPTLGTGGVTVDLRDYFKPGDIITISGSTSNNGDEVVSTVNNATDIITVGALTSETDTGGVILLHKAGTPDLLVNTLGDVRYDDHYKTFISPERYWIFGEVYNMDANGIALPAKTYDSVVLTDFKMTPSSVGSADFGTDDFGATFSEYLVSDATVNANAWNILPTKEAGGVLETQTDYGYGAYNFDENGGGGFIEKFIPMLSFSNSAQYNIVDLPTLPALPAGDSLYLWVYPQTTGSNTTVNISTFEDVAGKRPFLLTTFEDEIPEHPTLKVAPFEDDGFLPHYTWEASADDLWYGLLIIDNSQIQSQYHNMLYHIPLNENLTGYATSSYASLIFLEDSSGTMVNPTIPTGMVEDRYDGLAGHTKKFNNTTNNMIHWPGANTGVGNGGKFSFLIHATPDIGVTGSSGMEKTYIAYQESTVNNDIDHSWYLAINTTGQIELSLQGKKTDTNLTNIATVLTSSSIIPRDGESPTAIAWSVDNELEAGNVKLYINGILESSSGLLRTTSASNTTNQWAKDLVLDTNAGVFCIGGMKPKTGTDYHSFNGKIEEAVAYSDAIYPVNPKDGEFVWTKPVKDFLGDKSTPLSYVSRIFIKDYHNIRGPSTSDVAVSPPVSFLKPILGNRGD
tara:strand:- start:4478 stop:9259 length:4782 start_codon:yes stop_codon:yes gene_type:complete